MIVSGFSVAAVTDWMLITMGRGVSHQVARNESEIILARCSYNEKSYKRCKMVGKEAFSSTENTKENTSDMAWSGGQKFSG